MEQKKITFDSFIRSVIAVIIVVGIVMLLNRLSSVLLPFFLAWLISYLLFPLVKFFQYRCHLKFRIVGIFCAFLVVGIVLTGLCWVMIPPMIEEGLRVKDMLVDIGPGPGIHGGKVVASGTPEEIMRTPGSITGDYLAGRRKIEIPVRHRPEKGWLRLYGASGNNLKSVDLAIPEGLFTCVTGVSGSGKSTLINETLYKIASEKLNGAINEMPLPYERIEGLELFDKVIDINQNPIGRTPRSNPATYTGLFTEVRELFASVPESRARGYGPGRFSFNVKGGRCEACQGDGVIKVEMNFLPVSRLSTRGRTSARSST